MWLADSANRSFVLHLWQENYNFPQNGCPEMPCLPLGMFPSVHLWSDDKAQMVYLLKFL